MAVARAALALAFVASATQTGGAEPCAPRAELGGDAEAVAKVAAELQRLGVEATTDPMLRGGRTKCPTIVAAVELDHSGGIAVAVRDASQRSEGRVVSDAALAAAWIDSWLRDEFAAPPTETAVTVAPVEEKPAPPAATPLLERFAFGASYLTTWAASDSTWWSGVAVSGCGRLDGFCIGARVGYAHQTVTKDLTAAAKTDFSALATASYAQPIGRMSIAPELGVGVGRTTIERLEGCKMTMVDPNCDPMDPTCVNQPPEMCTNPTAVYVGDAFRETSYTPRVAAALRLAIPLFEHVWLDGFAAATLAPFAHTEDYAAASPDGTTMTMPGGGGYPLPGDSQFGLQLGIGLRVGAP